MKRNELVEVLRDLGIGIGRPEQRDEVADKIIASGHALTEEDAKLLLKHAVDSGASNPSGLLYRWFSSDSWRGVLEDIRAHQRFMASVGIGQVKKAQDRPKKTVPSHYSERWAPPAYRDEEHQKERVVYAALGDAWAIEDIASTFGMEHDDIRSLVDTSGRMIFGDLLADRWLGKITKKTRRKARRET